MPGFSFGEFSDEHGYKVLDEREVRGASGIMLLLGFVAFVYGFVIKQYDVLPWITGFLMLNFLVGVAINPNYTPVMLVAKVMTWKQEPLLIGAIQKRFAWSLGLLLSGAIFGMSLLLVNDASWFDSVCFLCLICLLFLFLETAFGICVGCQIYKLGVRTGIIPKPKITPRCTGDVCETEP